MVSEVVRLYRRDSDIVIANLVLERERLRKALSEIMVALWGQPPQVSEAYRIAKEAHEKLMFGNEEQND